MQVVRERKKSIRNCTGYRNLEPSSEVVTFSLFVRRTLECPEGKVQGRPWSGRELALSKAQLWAEDPVRPPHLTGDQKLKQSLAFPRVL